jgi:hypothetical protein
MSRNKFKVAQLNLQHVQLIYVSIFDAYFVPNFIPLMLMKNYSQYNVKLIADEKYNLPRQLLLV